MIFLYNFYPFLFDIIVELPLFIHIYSTQSSQIHQDVSGSIRAYFHGLKHEVRFKNIGNKFL